MWKLNFAYLNVGNPNRLIAVPCLKLSKITADARGQIISAGCMHICCVLSPWNSELSIATPTKKKRAGVLLPRSAMYFVVKSSNFIGFALAILIRRGTSGRTAMCSKRLDDEHGHHYIPLSVLRSHLRTSALELKCFLSDAVGAPFPEKLSYAVALLRCSSAFIVSMLNKNGQQYLSWKCHMTYAVTVTSFALVMFVEFSSSIFWALSSLLHCQFVKCPVKPKFLTALTQSLWSLLLFS